MMPQGGDYFRALQSPRCFPHPSLAGSTVRMRARGISGPVLVSGRCGVVCDVVHRGRRYAVKCFTEQIQDLSERYDAISGRLVSIGQPWKIAFEFIPEGILVNGSHFPVLKMDWVQGSTLEQYITAHLGNRSALTRLQQRFQAVVRDLADAGIAHGDLQHGNILVLPSGELRLVDYDGMFVPGARHLGSTERGHANFQSPFRATQYGPHLDRFSAWVIDLSLRSLVIDPSLWQAAQGGDDALLFTESDYADPRASKILQLLGRKSDPLLRRFADIVYGLAHEHDLDKIPVLQDPVRLRVPQIAWPAPSPRGRRTGASPTSGTPWYVRTSPPPGPSAPSRPRGPSTRGRPTTAPQPTAWHALQPPPGSSAPPPPPLPPRPPPSPPPPPSWPPGYGQPYPHGQQRPYPPPHPYGQPYQPPSGWAPPPTVRYDRLDELVKRSRNLLIAAIVCVFCCAYVEPFILFKATSIIREIRFVDPASRGIGLARGAQIVSAIGCLLLVVSLLLSINSLVVSGGS
jgi:hypothetical protein